MASLLIFVDLPPPTEFGGVVLDKVDVRRISIFKFLGRINVKFKARLFVIFIFLSWVCPPVAFANSVKDAVVKIFVTSNRMDFYRPWQSLGSSGKTGSGCIISGNRILTNAHVVSDSTFIQVRKESDPKRYTAHLQAVGHDCDLALLTVDDPKFFEGISPLEMGELPNLQDSVSVIGYPEGGDKISITEGVVSRIEIIGYSQSSRKLIAVQIDAAINPGNSGGPGIKDGKLIGIAMQGISESQNIGYMIPTPVIKHFFNDLQDSHYEGFPIIGIDITDTENPALREFYKIQDKIGGVLVTKIIPYSSSDGILKEDDVILEIDDIPLGMDGTFEFRGNERLYLSHLINEKQMGGDVKIKIIRDGQEKITHVKLKSFAPLVPLPNYFSKPSYYIYGGLVFTVLSSDLLSTWGGRWWEKGPLDFLYYLIGTGRLNNQSRQELVVLLQVLPDDINVGYHDISNEVIAKVDGQEIKSFKDFVLILNNNKSKKYTIIETEHNLRIILENTDIEKITAGILKRNNIPFQYSDDVAEWLGVSYPKSLAPEEVK